MDGFLTDGSGAELAPRDTAVVFVPDEDLGRLVGGTMRKLGVDTVSIRRGTIRDAVSFFSKNPSPSHLIVDLGSVSNPLGAVRDLASVCEPQTRVMLFGTVDTVDLYRDLMRAGVTDYLVKPIAELALERSLNSLFAHDQHNAYRDRTGTVIGVIGATGGVGATTIASNLAWTFAARHRRQTALIDLDLNASTLQMLMDAQGQAGLLQAVRNPDRLDASLLEQMTAFIDDRLGVIAASADLDAHIALQPAAIDQLLTLATHRFHLAVVDIPRSPSASALDMMELMDAMIIVCEPNLPSVGQAARWQQVLQDRKYQGVASIVFNETRPVKKSVLSQKELLSLFGKPVDFQIAFDKASRVHADTGILAAKMGKGAIAKGVSEIARKLVESPPEAKSRWLRLPFMRSGS